MRRDRVPCFVLAHDVSEDLNLFANRYWYQCGFVMQFAWMSHRPCYANTIHACSLSSSSHFERMSLFADSISCLRGLNIAPNFGSTLDITTPVNILCWWDGHILLYSILYFEYFLNSFLGVWNEIFWFIDKSFCYNIVFDILNLFFLPKWENGSGCIFFRRDI